jgi:hypothetical protein
VQQQIVGVGTSAGPALAPFNTTPYLAWKGQANEPSIWWSTFNGSSWSAQKQVPGAGTSAEVSLTALNARLYAVWKGEGTDPRLFWSSFDGSGLAAQQVIPGNSSAGPAGSKDERADG